MRVVTGMGTGPGMGSGNNNGGWGGLVVWSGQGGFPGSGSVPEGSVTLQTARGQSRAFEADVEIRVPRFRATFFIVFLDQSREPFTFWIAFCLGDCVECWVRDVVLALLFGCCQHVLVGPTLGGAHGLLTSLWAILKFITKLFFQQTAIIWGNIF